MDLSLDNSQQAIDLPLSPSEDNSRTLRSSTRAKVPKQKDIIPDHTSSESSNRQTRSVPPKRTRDTKGKAKSQESTEDRSSSSSKKCVFTLSPPLPTPLSHSSLPNRPRRTTYPNLTINEPIRDTKGKKRAAPEVVPSEDLSASAPAASSKRPRSATTTTAYALRPREMPKKMR